jgi:hypothetical protein
MLYALQVEYESKCAEGFETGVFLDLQVATCDEVDDAAGGDNLMDN